MTTRHPLNDFRSHAASSLVDPLANYLGVGRDIIQFTELLSLMSGRMGMPVHLDIISDNTTIDLHIAQRILSLRRDNIARVDTHIEFRSLEQERLNISKGDKCELTADQLPLDVILIRGVHRSLHRDSQEYLTYLYEGSHLPSIWRVTSNDLGLLPIPGTLRLQTCHAKRQLESFGDSFAVPRKCKDEEKLVEIIEKLPTSPDLTCSFRSDYQGSISPEWMLSFERFLRVFTSLRSLVATPADNVAAILPSDYLATRSLLTSLPLTPIDRDVSANALVFAEDIFPKVKNGGGQSLPDRSQDGSTWFTRHDARKWTGLGYNTVKKHIAALEGEGILRSTLAESNRERGRQIHYRFAEERAPPFGWRNPFAGLPEMGQKRQISNSTDCAGLLNDCILAAQT